MEFLIYSKLLACPVRFSKEDRIRFILWTMMATGMVFTLNQRYLKARRDLHRKDIHIRLAKTRSASIDYSLFLYLLGALRLADSLRLTKDQERELEEAFEYFYFKSGSDLARVKVSEIVSLEAKNKYVHLTVKDRKEPFEILGTLESALKALEGAGFCQCHRSYVVNFMEVELLRKKTGTTRELQMRDGSCIPVSRRYYEEMASRLGG